MQRGRHACPRRLCVGRHQQLLAKVLVCVWGGGRLGCLSSLVGDTKGSY
jgi:hypothetical protein